MHACVYVCMYVYMYWVGERHVGNECRTQLMQTSLRPKTIRDVPCVKMVDKVWNTLGGSKTELAVKLGNLLGRIMCHSKCAQPPTANL